MNQSDSVNEWDLITEFIDEGSQPITPHPAAPILNAEEQALADAVRRYQNEHRRAQLTWRDIFEIVQALGYRKVEQPASPQANGSPLGGARAGDPENEIHS